MFASFSRLDLGTVRPSHVKTILSGPLPIFGRHRDRVCEISFEGMSAGLNIFFDVTICSFPALESLVLNFKAGFELKVPDTFFRGPKLSDLHLRRLRFGHALTYVSGFLSSATALTDLSLEIDIVFGPSPETSFLVCL
jgi:hypothetical protein